MSPNSTQPHLLLQAAGDPTRLRLLRLLQREELNVQEIVGILGMGQPRVSKHLAVLRDAGWLRQRREGTWSWYAAVAVDQSPGGAAIHSGVMAAAAAVREATADDAALGRALRARERRSRRFFTGAAARWDEIRASYELPEAHLAALAALVPEGLAVVDVGTGTGALLPLLAGAGCRITAVDNSEQMLERARELCAREGLTGVAFQRADLQALPLADGACDAAFSSMVLHHVASPAAALAEMARCVRAGGRIVLLDFTRHGQTWMRDELAHQWLGFDRAEIERLMTQAGLAPRAYQVFQGAQARAQAEAPATDSKRAGAKAPARGRGARAAWPDLFLAVAAKP